MSETGVEEWIYSKNDATHGQTSLYVFHGLVQFSFQALSQEPSLNYCVRVALQGYALFFITRKKSQRTKGMRAVRRLTHLKVRGPDHSLTTPASQSETRQLHCGMLTDSQRSLGKGQATHIAQCLPYSAQAAWRNFPLPLEFGAATSLTSRGKGWAWGCDFLPGKRSSASGAGWLCPALHPQSTTSHAWAKLARGSTDEQQLPALRFSGWVLACLSR